MARIRPYESQVSPLGQVPTQQAQLADVGGPGMEHVGQAITSAGAAGAHAYQILQANEDAHATTKVHVSMAELANRATQELAKQKATADPADPNFFNTVYRGGVADGEEPATGSIHDQLNKLREQVTNPVAQRRFETEAAALTHQVLVQSTAFQGHLAGVHAKQQAIQLTNQLQAMVQTDPSQHTNALAMMTTAVNDPQGIFYRPGMDAGARELILRSMTEQISSSTVRGMIGDSPQHALHSLQSGEWDAQITGEQKIVLMNAAETGIRAMEVEAQRAEAEVAKQQKAKEETTSRALTAKFLLHEGNPGNAQFPPLTATEIGRAMLPNTKGKSDLSDETGRALFGLIDANTKAVTLKNDESLSQDYLRRIYLPWGDKDKIISEVPIINAAANGKLTPARFKFLRDEYEKARTEEGMTLGGSRDRFLASRKTSITTSNPLLGKLDSDGDVNFGRFAEFAVTEEARMRKENKNPHNLYDETNPDYLGHRMMQFQKTMQQSLKDMGKKMQSTEPTPPMTQPRLKGETIEQYKKRTNP